MLESSESHFNSHYISKSRYGSVRDRPDSLFFLSDIHGGAENLILPVPEHEYLYAKNHVLSQDENN